MSRHSAHAVARIAIVAALGCAAGCAGSARGTPPASVAAPSPASSPAAGAGDAPFGAPADPEALRDREERSREIPPDLDTRRLRASRDGRYRVSLRCARPQPELNRIHNWFVRVLDAEGRPVDGLRLEFDGGMPAHGHGFPTRPRVTRDLGNGTYLVEGVKFNMAGWWEFVVRIDDGAGSDEARFNLVVED